MDIVTRQQWGARPPRSTSSIPLPSPDLWLHHTAGREQGEAGMRAIQRFHMDTRGWSDIGYSFVYCPTTRTWFEGRGAGVAGAHTSGHNRTSHGLCVMGNYSKAVPDSETLDDVAAMVAHGHRQGWWPDRISGGHRDVGSTSCPGDNLYAHIAAINQRATTAGDDMTPELEAKVDQVLEGIAWLRDRTMKTNQAVGRMENVHGAGLADLPAGGDIDPRQLAADIASELARRLSD